MDYAYLSCCCQPRRRHFFFRPKPEWRPAYEKNGSRIFQIVLPFSVDGADKKAAQTQLYHCAALMREREVAGFVAEAGLAGYLNIFTEMGLSAPDGSCFHKFLLPQALKLYAKDKGLDLDDIQIAVGAGHASDAVYLLEQLQALHTRFVLIQNPSAQAAAEEVFDSTGIPVRTALSLSEGILLYVDGMVPDMARTVRVLDFSGKTGRSSFSGYSLEPGKAQIIGLEPSLGLCELMLRCEGGRPEIFLQNFGVRIRGFTYFS